MIIAEFRVDADDVQVLNDNSELSVILRTVTPDAAWLKNQLVGRRLVVCIEDVPGELDGMTLRSREVDVVAHGYNATGDQLEIVLAPTWRQQPAML
jgi:hypothetical protein